MTRQLEFANERAAREQDHAAKLVQQLSRLETTVDKERNHHLEVEQDRNKLAKEFAAAQDEMFILSQNMAAEQQANTSLRSENKSLSMRLCEEQESRGEVERELRVRTRELRDERQLRVEQAQAIVRLGCDAASRRQIDEMRGNLQILNVAGDRRDNEMIDIANRVHRE